MLTRYCRLALGRKAHLFFVSPSARFKTVTCGWLTHGRFLFFASPKKRNPKKGEPGWRDISLASATLGSRLRPNAPSLSRGPVARLLRVALSGRSPNVLRCSGAPYGAQPQNHGSFTLPPRRRASVEDRPKSSPTGHRKDSVRAHPG